MKYQGWTNYETWIANLWLGNDEPTYRLWQEIAAQSETVEQLEGTLRGSFEDAMPELDGMYADLLSAAMQEINWYEIAETMMPQARIEKGARDV